MAKLRAMKSVVTREIPSAQKDVNLRAYEAAAHKLRELREHTNPAPAGPKLSAQDARARRPSRRVLIKR